ncbi:acyl-coenzyme A thioesterase PaaI-like protein [Halospina denitrificans]|uniref:Acyl-coenzyme A thioesterase PaaI-like protein n=1 Tax=Halospina denitrificans TaxID=332522 RepID=A0A4R7JSK9_9GAMM|nr:hotdog fold domain-containing protein [Halospina denitrificans]TDT40273.1 acyl-coenzyme A thioesterase PaaI-like protein [Halospina denitrificans]
MPAKSPTLRMYERFAAMPGGRAMFSRALCFRAPYFQTIRPRVETLEPTRSVWHMKKRRAVENHIGTVHALAMGNLCEIAAGTLMEAGLPASKRWIPKSMTIDYLAKANTDLVGEATHDALDSAEGDVPVVVTVRDKSGTAVVQATITMFVSAKKAKST